MRSLATATLAALLALAAPGCKDEPGRPGPSGKVAEPPAAAAADEAVRPLAELLGAPGNPIGPLAKLTIGMSEADAKAAAPTLVAEGKDYQMAPVPGQPGMSYGVGLDEETRAVSGLSLDLPAARKADLEAAWGPGLPAVDTIKRPQTAWFDPATGWRAVLETGFGDALKLRFTKYVPAAAVIGQGKDALGFADGKPVLGATLDELRAAHGARLVEESQAEAEKQRAGMERLAGQKLDKKLGAAHASARIELPPTEWEGYWTRVHLRWDGDRVQSVSYSLPYAAHAPAKDALWAMFEKTWGKPKETSQFGRKIWLFNKSPKVTVKDNTISGAWDIEVSPK